MMNAQRIGLFGGSFNPVHEGHVQLAQAIQSECPCTPLIIMPTQTPPHKKPFTVSAEHRLAMTRLAFGHLPHIEVSEDELRHNGPNYTYDTLMRMKKRFPQAELCLGIGADSFLDLPQWYQWEKLRKLCTFVVGIRIGCPTKAIDVLRNEMEATGSKVLILKASIPAVSSSEVRNLLALSPQTKLSGLVPEDVATYLKKFNLYAKPTDHV